MNKRYRVSLFLNIALFLASFICVFFFVVTSPGIDEQKTEKKEEGKALDAFNWWYGQRASTQGLIPTQSIERAHRYAARAFKKEKPQRHTNGVLSQWESIGPNNVGGRVLSLAVDPLNPNILWAGSASGGLWKSTTKGIGADAWDYVSTGFPTISVSAIAIDQTNPATMYIGTGEISYYLVPLVGTPGARASYGMGILKSTDAGTTWQQTSLTSDFSDITAIQRIAINPLNSNTLYSATSEGIFKSTDAGESWTQVLSVVMAMDVVIIPSDTNTLISAHGNLNSSPNQGMYRTTNGGSTWIQLSGGLPTMNFGRTALSVAPSNPNIIYAGISNGSSLNIIGLYKSTNIGITWSQMSTINYVGGQGWYNNAVAAHPQNENVVFCAGLDLYKSTAGGANLTHKSNWTAGYSYQIPPGEAEGTFLYVHADHHAIAFDPLDTNVVYLGTDGGVFQSTDGGETFAGRNGGFVTTQFYSGFANSATNQNFAFGGLQDNGVLKYVGSVAWDKVDGGDGGWCAINPANNNIVYDEYVYLMMSRSVNGGASFSPITNGLSVGSTNANFIAPFVISPSNPNILYAGAKNIFKTVNGGTNWTATNGGANLNGTKISCIAVSWTSPDTLMAATGTGTYNASPLFQVFASHNGGTTWSNVTGVLPERYPTDIYFDTKKSATAFITYSGYGGSHVFKTTNLGQSWIDISSNLPDIPVQSIVNDPEEPEHLFVGSDLGVFLSTDGGASWNDFNAGMPPAMVTDLTTFNPTGILRAATFGNGVYQRELPRTPTLTLVSPSGGELFVSGRQYPITWTQKHTGILSLQLSLNGGATWDTIANGVAAASESFLWTAPLDSTKEGRIRIIHLEDGTALDSTETFFSIILNPDVLANWNSVSVHLNVANPLKDSLFPTSIGEAYSFHNGYINLDTLANGYGYWIKFEEPQHVNIEGDSIFSLTVNVNPRWNLIGSISIPVAVTQLQQSIDGLITSPIYGYDDGYYIADSIKPMRGYWVKASQSGEVTLSSSSAKNQKVDLISERINEFTCITISDKTGKSQRLYLGMSQPEYTALNIEAPPKPPGGAFDARFASNSFVTLLPERSERDIELPISIASAAFPLTITLTHDNNIGYVLMLDSEKESSPLDEGTSLQITRPSRVLAGSEEAQIILTAKQEIESPNAFRLEQNYPNPFNPVTVIGYTLSVSSHVTLKVYDVLGREVVTLVDGFQASGFKSQTFDASVLPSGIYFYQLSAGKFVETRKMLLLR
ncbi:MAG: T9SS type A sorting domain-containing protein [Bacteroidetes bacterium]|nr:MAG: T9SS type A sorting domain-containing protein [Bacteroidota bacterium]